MLRKDKLSEITGYNQKIYIRINMQESHYSKNKMMENYNKHKNASPLGSRVENAEER